MTDSNDSKANPGPRTNRWRRILQPRHTVPELQFSDPAELSAWIAAWLAPKLGIPVDEIDHKTPFTEYGLDSIAAVELSGRLERVLGRPVSPSAAWEYPSIEELSEHILSGAAPALTDMDL